jgi:hypothetical protein
MACVKRRICVRSASEGAWGKGLEATEYAQEEFFGRPMDEWE